MTFVTKLDEMPAVKGYLDRIGAEARSLTTAIVKEKNGRYWNDVARIKFKADGSIVAEGDYVPTDQEQMNIKQAFANVKFPKMIFGDHFDRLPEWVRNAEDEDLFYFKDRTGNLLMIQHRVELDDGKRYVPYTFWEDGRWRPCEPEGKLPLWGMDRLGDYTTVFIHEGAKAARSVSDMVEGVNLKAKQRFAEHPWREELAGAAHLGWIGGALAPGRTDWKELMRLGVKRVYIVADNDNEGKAAIPRIAQQLRIPCFSIEFTQDWPPAFDLADPFPSKWFKEIEGKRYYTGPDIRDIMHPATWATDLVPPPPGSRGRPTQRLREAFRDQWAYVEALDMYCHVELLDILRDTTVVNKMLSPFSHSVNTARLINQAYAGRKTTLCYRPDSNERLIRHNSFSAINQHHPSRIKAEPGDPQPFLDFMAYMFPNEEECWEMMRWCATLIARPSTRMLYSILLVSEATGIGKTLLAAEILAPLVGWHNSSFPSETDITQGEFNSWCVNKRLIIVNEIYSGHSWKAYHKLKSVITDDKVRVNEKYQRAYSTENWAHVIASSNSLRALKMESDDRRWFYPTVNEDRWPLERFGAFRAWLEAGGLSIVRWWAENLGDYVQRGERSPMTTRKKHLIAESRSEAQTEANHLGEALMAHPEPACLAMRDVVGFIRSSVQGRVFDTDVELRKAMKEARVSVFPDRIKVNGRMQYVLHNAKAGTLLVAENNPKKHPEILRSNIVNPADLLEANM